MLTLKDFIQTIERFKSASKTCTHPKVQAALTALDTLVQALPNDGTVLLDDEAVKTDLQEQIQKANERCEQLKKDIEEYKKEMKNTKETASPSGNDFLQQVAPNN